jgi:hypothetical protein
LLLPFRRAGGGISGTIYGNIKARAGLEFDQNVRNGVYRRQQSCLEAALIRAAQPSFPNSFDTLARFPVVWEQALIDMRKFYCLGVGRGYESQFAFEVPLDDNEYQYMIAGIKKDQKRIADTYKYPLKQIEREVQSGGPEALPICQHWLYMESRLEETLMNPMTLGSHGPVNTSAKGLLFPWLDLVETGKLLASHRETNRGLFLKGYQEGQELSERVSPENMLNAFASCILLGKSSTGK